MWLCRELLAANSHKNDRQQQWKCQCWFCKLTHNQNVKYFCKLNVQVTLALKRITASIWHHHTVTNQRMIVADKRWLLQGGHKAQGNLSTRTAASSAWRRWCGPDWRHSPYVSELNISIRDNEPTLPCPFTHVYTAAAPSWWLLKSTTGLQRSPAAEAQWQQHIVCISNKKNKQLIEIFVTTLIICCAKKKLRYSEQAAGATSHTVCLLYIKYYYPELGFRERELCTLC